MRNVRSLREIQEADWQEHTSDCRISKSPTLPLIDPEIVGHPGERGTHVAVHLAVLGLQHLQHPDASGASGGPGMSLSDVDEVAALVLSHHLLGPALFVAEPAQQHYAAGSLRK